MRRLLLRVVDCLRARRNTVKSFLYMSAVFDSVSDICTVFSRGESYLLLDYHRLKISPSYDSCYSI